MGFLSKHTLWEPNSNLRANNKSTTIIGLLLLMLIQLTAVHQTKGQEQQDTLPVSGTVSQTDGETIPGVTVQVKNTNQGTNHNQC